MKKIWKLSALSVAITALIMGSGYLYRMHPGSILLYEGEARRVETSAAFSLTPSDDGAGALSMEQTEDASLLSRGYTLLGDEPGRYEMELSLFRVIPLGAVPVDVVPREEVIVGGNTIGIKLYTEGLLVVQKAKILTEAGESVSPWENLDIQAGDYIMKANGKALDGSESLAKEVDSSGGAPVTLLIQREGRNHEVVITPAKSVDDNCLRLGLWVRDSTAGIGTMTFALPESKRFCALGHAICDMDTGAAFTVMTGEIVDSTVVSISKGEKGVPGELQGAFKMPEKSMGIVTENSALGIFGEYEGDSPAEGRRMPAALISEVETGDAVILSNIKGEEIREYAIEIERVYPKSFRSPKGMVIHVTDPELLAEAGGIVQGMSGSPILQNGKIVGAVTHVFVNDPTRGYGIFIENMLAEANKNEE